MLCPVAVAKFTATKARLAPATHRAYHYDLARVSAHFVDRHLETLTLLDLEDFLATLPSGYAHGMAKRLTTFFKWAFARGLAPAALAPKSPHRTAGFPPWQKPQIEQYRRHWPPGSRQRAIFEAALLTGLRRSDLARLLWQPKGDAATQKTGSDIYLLPPAADYGPPLTALSLGLAFTDWARAAGIEGRSLHGLRKTAACRAAEAGCSAHELMVLFGWRTLAMAQHYTAGLDRARLAKSALARLMPPGITGGMA